MVEEQNVKRNNKKMIAIIAIIAAVAVALVFFVHNFQLQTKYNDALALMDSKKYGEAEVAFSEIQDYQDSADKVKECQDLYGELFSTTAASIYIDCFLSQYQCSLISELWGTAIDNGADFNEVIQNFLQDLENGKEPDSEIDNLKSTIDENMIALQNPTSDYTEAYASLVEIYGIYIQIYDQSKNPSGSLLTFNSAVKDLSSQFESSYGQLKVLKPEIEQQVKEKMQESDDAI